MGLLLRGEPDLECLDDRHAAVRRSHFRGLDVEQVVQRDAGGRVTEQLLSPGLQFLPVLGLVFRHLGEKGAGIVATCAAELGGKHLVAMAGLHLDELREIESVHQAELGQVKSGSHGIDSLSVFYQ